MTDVNDKPKGSPSSKGTSGGPNDTAAGPPDAVDENKLIAERRTKLAAVRESTKQAGTAVFPNDFRRNALAAQLHAAFGERDTAWLEANPTRVDVGGRMLFKRVMGKASFAKIADRTGQNIAEVAATYFATEAFFRLDAIVGAARGIVISDYFDRLALDRALDSIGDAERRLTAAMAGNGAAGTHAVEAWVAPRRAEVDRIRMSVHEIANSGLTLSKLSVAASLLGDLVKG